MHMILRLVVEANDVEHAVNRAVDYFDGHLHHESGGPFDYAKPMVNDNRVSGSGRWTLYQDEPLAFEAGSLRGWREIESAWQSTVDEAERSIEELTEIFDNADDTEEVMNEFTTHMHSNTFGYGPNTERFLYWVDRYHDQSGASIYEPDAYDDLTDAVWDSDETYYVVPLDAHR